MSEPLQTLAPGFRDPVLESQNAFRAVLSAMSRPGRIEPVALQTEPPAPLTAAAAAVLLTLVDMDTPLWLDDAADQPAVRDWLRFHCGCPLSGGPGEAAFALIADPRTMPPLHRFAAGDSDFPDRSATLVLQVQALTDSDGLSLRGPGIETVRQLAAAPLPEDFQAQCRANHALYPCGVDLLLAGPDRLAALPRSIRMGDD